MSTRSGARWLSPSMTNRIACCGRAEAAVCACATAGSEMSNSAANQIFIRDPYPGVRGKPSPLTPLPFQTCRLVQPKRDDDVAGRNRHELFAVGEITNRGSVDGPVAPKRPQPFSRRRIQGEDDSLNRPAEHEITRR